MFLTLLVVCSLTTSLSFSMTEIETIIFKERENPTTARAEARQQEEAREQRAAEELRIRNLTTNHTTPLSNGPHTSTTSLSPHATTLTTPITTTAAGERTNGLTIISTEEAEKISETSRGNHDFNNRAPVDKTPQVLEKEAKNKKIHALIGDFRTQLPKFIEEEKLELSTKQQGDLLETFIDETLKAPQDSLIPEFLQKAKDMSKKKTIPVEGPMQEAKPTLTPDQQIIADAIARARARPEFALTKQILSDFEKELETRTSLPFPEKLRLASEFRKIVLADPGNADAIEVKKTELLKSADQFNKENKDSKEAAAKEKVAKEKAAREKAAHEASEKQRLQVLEKTTIEKFENELSDRKLRTFLTDKEVADLTGEFEQLVSKNPDDTEAITRKSTELLQEAGRLDKLGRLADQKALDAEIEQEHQETERQNEKPLDTAIKRISKIDAKTADALEKLKATITANTPDATVDQMFALREIISTVTKGLPKDTDTPNGKTFFGKPKWSSAQKKQAQKALDAADKALTKLFPKKTMPSVSSPKTEIAPKNPAKVTKLAPLEKTNPVSKKPWHQKLLENLKKAFKSPKNAVAIMSKITP